MLNFIRSMLIPSEKNNRRPFLLRENFFIIYIGLAVIIFLLLSPIGELGINNWLASLTQKLIIAEVNPDREAANLLPLQINEKLTKAAQLKAKDMVNRDYFAHIGPDGERPWVWLDQAEYQYARAGENLAIDFFDPAALERAWMNSPSHARNIMNEYFSDIGIGIASGEINGRETTVVVMFLGVESTSEILKSEVQIEESLARKSEVVMGVEAKKVENPIVLSEEDLASIPPEETIGISDEKNLLIIGLGEELNSLVAEPAKTNLISFLVSKGIEFSRFVLSSFFIFLLIWTLFAALFLKRLRLAPHFAMTRILGLVISLFLLWSPEFFF